MTGVFGAGVGTSFWEKGLTPDIEAIYGASAGIMTGAYLVSGQARLGSSIYLEDLGSNFISIKNFLIGTWQRFQNRFIKTVPENKIRDAMNIDYLMDIFKNKKPLDTNRIISQNIPTYAKLLNLEDYSIDYCDIRRHDIFDILKAGIGPIPYIHHILHVGRKKYIDAALAEPIGIDTLMQRHPDSKIIIVLNWSIKETLRTKAKTFLEAKVSEWMLNDHRIFKLYSNFRNNLERDLKLIEESPNITLIKPPKKFSVNPSTTNPQKILDLYNAGINEGTRIMNDIIKA